MVKERGPDRRKKAIDFRRRKLNRREKTFYYQRKAYLTDTNFYGNVYFAQYFDFIGEAREDFFKTLLGNDYQAFQSFGIGISTVDSSIKYLKELYLFDEFTVVLKIKKIHKIKVFMEFEFINDFTKEKSAIAQMTLCFTKEKKAIVIPELLISKLKAMNFI